MYEGQEIIICPICRKTIHQQYASPIVSRAVMSSRSTPGQASSMLTQMMLSADAMHEEIVRAAEETCAKHYLDKHPRRLRLWKRLKWNWLMQRRWPWSRPRGEIFDFSKAVRP